MQITINTVSTEFKKTDKGGYGTVNLQYTNERGENKTWKQMSFANPKVYDVLKAAKAGEVYQVTTGKNDKDFTVWSAIEKTDSIASTPSKQAATPYKSTYETAEERALKQRLIVRQSALNQAVASLTPGAKAPIEFEKATALAEQYMEWVYEQPTVEVPSLLEMENDIPY